MAPMFWIYFSHQKFFFSILFQIWTAVSTPRTRYGYKTVSDTIQAKNGKLAKRNLHRQGFETFLPMQKNCVA